MVAIAGALRSTASTAAALLGATVVMGAGIALCQPALPTLVRQWFPSRTGQATAAFSNGMLIGEIAGASLTAPLLLSLLSGWRPALAVWSVPVAATAAAVVGLTRHEPRPREQPPARWWPDWKSRGTVLLGVVLGCSSIGYFATNAFLPDYLRSAHEPGLTPLALAAINIAQLPPSFAVAVAPGRLTGRRGPLVAAGAIMLVAAVGLIVFGHGWVVIAASALIGFAAASVFVLALALPAALPRPEDVARVSAAIFTVSYTCAILGPLASGSIWDLTQVPAGAFAPVVAAGAVIAAGSLVLEIPGHLRTAAARA